MNQDRIRVLVCEPNKNAYTEKLLNTKEAYKQFVGGEYRAEPVDKNTVIIYNKTMTEQCHMPNRNIGELIACGKFFLATASDDGLYKSMDIEQLQYYNSILGKPEHITKQDCKMNSMYGRKSVGKMFVYINNLNFHMKKTRTDFAKIAESYKTTDKTAAKEFLKEMHNLFVDTYGTDQIDDLADADEEMVCLPAVLQSEKTGNIQIGLVEVDTGSSGEHWGTQHVTSRGFVVVNDETIDAQCKAELHSLGTYKYWYTPEYYGDIHVNESDMPEEVRNIIDYAVDNGEQMQGMNME